MLVCSYAPGTWHVLQYVYARFVWVCGWVVDFVGDSSFSPSFIAAVRRLCLRFGTPFMRTARSFFQVPGVVPLAGFIVHLLLVIA